MTERFAANCQYDDCRGSIAIDESPPKEGQDDLLQEMASKANVPKGYLPVGFRVGGPGRDANLEPTCTFSITLVAVRENEAGPGLDQIEEYGRKHGRIPVYPFALEMDVRELLKFLQRLDVAVLVRDLHDHPVEVEQSA